MEKCATTKNFSCLGYIISNNIICSTESQTNCNVKPLPIREDADYCRMVHVYYDCMLMRESDKCQRFEYNSYYSCIYDKHKYCFTNVGSHLKSLFLTVILFIILSKFSM